jgi:hypothetical protein
MLTPAERMQVVAALIDWWPRISTPRAEACADAMADAGADIDAALAAVRIIAIEASGWPTPARMLEALAGRPRSRAVASEQRRETQQRLSDRQRIEAARARANGLAWLDGLTADELAAVHREAEARYIASGGDFARDHLRRRRERAVAQGEDIHGVRRELCRTLLFPLVCDARQRQSGTSPRAMGWGKREVVEVR